MVNKITRRAMSGLYNKITSEQNTSQKCDTKRCSWKA